MKREYLMDANDAFKKMVLAWLRPNLCGLRAVPMITEEPGRWGDEDWNTYAEILGIPVDWVLLRNEQFCGRNAAVGDYFARLRGAADGPADILQQCADLLVDPDTGLSETGGGTTHLNASELALLLGGGTNGRVVVVYQHANRNRGQIGGDLQRRCNSVARAMQPLNRCWAFAVVASSITLLLFSRDRGRLEGLRELCVAGLRGLAHDRLTCIVEGGRALAFADP